jgi:predicted enzyme related to lactoylglutathione lyase
MFFIGDIKGRLRAYQSARRSVHHAADQVTGSTIAQLNDTRGNIIQITQLARW